MLPSFSDLTYFIEVSQTLNISRASERLGITQPSLSAAMVRLESAVGVQLLVRSRKGVTLTKEGHHFASEAANLLHNWGEVVAKTKQGLESVSGRYTIGAHPSVALYSLDKFLPGLMHKYPELEVSLHHDLSRKITEEVISLKCDFGIVVNPVRHPDLVIVTLAKDVVRPFAVKTIKKYEPGLCLICDDNLVQSQKILRELGKSGLEYDRITTSSSLEVVAMLTAAGAGVGILPTRVAAHYEDLRPYSATKTDKSVQFEDEICLIYRADIPKNLGAKKIIEHIKSSKI